MSSAPNSTLPRLFLRPCEFGVLRNGLVKDCKHQETVCKALGRQYDRNSLRGSVIVPVDYLKGWKMQITAETAPTKLDAAFNLPSVTVTGVVPMQAKFATVLEKFSADPEWSFGPVTMATRMISSTYGQTTVEMPVCEISCLMAAVDKERQCVRTYTLPDIMNQLGLNAKLKEIKRLHDEVYLVPQANGEPLLKEGISLSTTISAPTVAPPPMRVLNSAFKSAMFEERRPYEHLSIDGIGVSYIMPRHVKCFAEDVDVGLRNLSSVFAARAKHAGALDARGQRVKLGDLLVPIDVPIYAVADTVDTHSWARYMLQAHVKVCGARTLLLQSRAGALRLDNPNARRVPPAAPHLWLNGVVMPLSDPSFIVMPLPNRVADAVVSPPTPGDEEEEVGLEPEPPQCFGSKFPELRPPVADALATLGADTGADRIERFHNALGDVVNRGMRGLVDERERQQHAIDVLTSPRYLQLLAERAVTQDGSESAAVEAARREYESGRMSIAEAAANAHKRGHTHTEDELPLSFKMRRVTRRQSEQMRYAGIHGPEHVIELNRRKANVVEVPMTTRQVLACSSFCRPPPEEHRMSVVGGVPSRAQARPTHRSSEERRVLFREVRAQLALFRESTSKD